MSEAETEMMRDIWRVVSAVSQRLERVELTVDSVDQTLDRARGELSARIDSSDRIVDKLAEQMSEGFVRMTHRIDALDEKLTRRFERVEARLDGIDGRLTTLTATVALHELELKEAK